MNLNIRSNRSRAASGRSGSGSGSVTSKHSTRKNNSCSTMVYLFGSFVALFLVVVLVLIAKISHEGPEGPGRKNGLRIRHTVKEKEHATNHQHYHGERPGTGTTVMLSKPNDDKDIDISLRNVWLVVGSSGVKVRKCK